MLLRANVRCVNEHVATDGHGSTAGTSRSRGGRRIVRWLVVTLIVLGAVFFAGGGWFFSGEIRDGALDVDPADQEMGLSVAAVTPGAITLEETSGDEAALTSEQTYGLVWPTGYGQISGPVQVRGSEVTRRLRVLDGSAPTSGQPAGLDRDAFPDDPRVALGSPVRQVQYRSPAGSFPAWLTAGEGRTWAIFVHGQTASRAEALRSMRLTADLGIPAMAITYRNDAGVAGGTSGFYGYGQTEWPDLEGAVRYATAHGADRVVLVGYSMGGAIVAAFLQHSALEGDVSAVVLDAPMLDLGATVSLGASQRSLPLVGLPVPDALTWTAKQLAAVRYDLDWDALDYASDPAWVDMPVLVFHGDADQKVPLATSRRLATARPDLVQLEVVPDAGHVEAWNANPRTYNAALRDFLQR